MSGELPNFHPDYCEKVAKIAAAASVFLLIVQVFILVAVLPTPQCPGWQITTKEGSSSLWGLVTIAALGVAASVYRALTWDRFVHKLIHGEAQEPSRFPPIAAQEGIKRYYRISEIDRKKIVTDRFFVVFNVGWTLFCGSPLILMLGFCVGWPKP